MNFATKLMQESPMVGKKVRNRILASRGMDNTATKTQTPDPQFSFELFESLTGSKALTQKELALEATPVVRTCGVYFLIKDREIVYVGQSTNVMRRVGYHTADDTKHFDSWSYIPVPADKLDVVESLYIHCFTPKQNGRTATSKGKTEYPLAPIALKNIVALNLGETENEQPRN